MKSGHPLRVAGYLRVSDPRQGYELARIYADEGLSAHNDEISKRPQFSALLGDVEAREFDMVVVHTLDRWARKLSVQSQSLQRLGRGNVGFASVTENLDLSTPAGRMLLAVMGAAHEFFSDQTGVHVTKSQAHRVRLGLPAGPVPFGYISPEPGGVPQVETREAEVVRGAFARRAAGASTGEIAGWLNASGFRTRKDHAFTAHAVKDMLNTRFYCGVVVYHGEEFPGQHVGIIPEDLFLQVQARRQRRDGRRQVHGAKGVLQGMISCARCGWPLQSDRQIRGAPMYRERHCHECETNGHSLTACIVDDQVGEIFGCLVVPEDWRRRMAQMAAARGEGEDVRVLMDKRRRLARAYADGGFSEAEYVVRLNDIDARIRVAQPVSQPSVEEAAALLTDLPGLWQEATNEERRRLIAPLIERVYTDVEFRRIDAITPAPVFRSLLEGALEQSSRSACVLFPAEVANRPEYWSWWRRGRIELPVQRKNVLSLLQACPAVESCRPGSC